MKHRFFRAAACAAALGLSGCGGGGGSGGGGTQPATNSPPSFTSAGSATVVENTAGVFYTATASDPDGDSLTFSVSGGADAARFSISGSGALQFSTPPNFDLPADADGDNVYQVTLSVSDGRLSASLPLSVTVSNSREGIAVRRIVTGFADPVAIAPIAGTRMFLVAERNGDIVQIDGATGGSTSLGNIFSGTLEDTTGFKLMALAPEPNFTTSGSVLAMAQTPSGTVFIRNYVRNVALWGSNFGSIRGQGGATYSDENLGWIGYGPDGSAYAMVSDGGGGAGTGDAAQDPDSLLGKLIRIRRNPDPYAGASPVFFLTSVLGSGLHQPNGGFVLDGELLFADRGRTAFEEVNRFALSATAQNFGWPFREGTETVRAGGPAGLVDPALQYPRGNAVRAGTGIVGGQAYAGPIPGLAGHYVFGDRKGAIWSIPLAQLRSGSLQTVAQLEVRTLDFTPDAGAIDAPVAFVTDSTGVLYVLDSDGELFRVDAG
jgi:glucose/arabinose dehydrogenase